MAKATEPQTNLKISRIHQFQQMIYLLILQNSPAANIINIKKPTLRVDNKMQKNISKTQISLHEQRSTAIFQPE